MGPCTVRADSSTSAKIMSMPAAKLAGWLCANSSPKAGTAGLRIGSASQALAGRAQMPIIDASK
jgi:hypothetical protein